LAAATGGLLEYTHNIVIKQTAGHSTNNVRQSDTSLLLLLLLPLLHPHHGDTMNAASFARM